MFRPLARTSYLASFSLLWVQDGDKLCSNRAQDWNIYREHCGPIIRVQGVQDGGLRRTIIHFRVQGPGPKYWDCCWSWILQCATNPIRELLHQDRKLCSWLNWKFQTRSHYWDQSRGRGLRWLRDQACQGWVREAYYLRTVQRVNTKSWKIWIINRYPQARCWDWLHVGKAQTHNRREHQTQGKTCTIRKETTEIRD